MSRTIDRLIVEPMEAFGEKFARFLPNLFSALLIMVIGLIAAWLVKHILIRSFRALKLDTFSERSGVSRVILKGGIRESFSVIMAEFIGCLVGFAFMIIALISLNVPAIEMLLERFFLYLPNVFVAFIVVLFGYVFSNFFGRAALIAAVNAEIRVAGLIGRVVRLSIFIFSLAIALEQLGIGRDTVTITFAVLFGGAVLALALAFGLGGRDIAKSYLERKVFRKEEHDDIEHI